VHAQSLLACLLACIHMTYLIRGMCGEGDVCGGLCYEKFVNLLCSGREDSNYTLEVG
jgi:hypothetical protein